MDDFTRIMGHLTELASADFVRKGLQDTAFDVEADAKNNCTPYVDTGMLRMSINSNVENTEAGYMAEVGTNCEYAPYNEYGTGIYAEKGDGRQTPWRYKTADGSWHYTEGMQPRPFLRPALNKHKHEVIHNIAQRLKEELAK